jgi:hypothetical protein
MEWRMNGIAEMKIIKTSGVAITPARVITVNK